MAHICWVGLDGSTSFHPCYEPGRRYYADRLYCRDENSLAVSVYIEVHFSSHFSASFLNSREFLNAAAAVVVVQLLCFVRFFVIPWTAACQAPLSFTVSWSLLNSCPLSWWYNLTISSSAAPSSPPALNLFQHQCLFQWISSLHQVAKVLEPQLQIQSFQDQGWSPLGLRSQWPVSKLQRTD